MFEHTLKEADRLGMGVDLATGTGWPFGGLWVGADDACKNFVHKTYSLKGGESLNEPISFVQKPVARAVNRRVDISELKDPISSNENLQALALDQVRFEKPLPLQALMAYSDKGRTLNLTDKVNANGKARLDGAGGQLDDLRRLPGLAWKDGRARRPRRRGQCDRSFFRPLAQELSEKIRPGLGRP